MVPQQSRLWLKNNISKMYCILPDKGSQSKVFILALFDTNSEIFTPPNGHMDSFWAYPSASKYGCLRILCNSQIRNYHWTSSKALAIGNKSGTSPSLFLKSSATWQ